MREILEHTGTYTPPVCTPRRWAAHQPPHCASPCSAETDHTAPSSKTTVRAEHCNKTPGVLWGMGLAEDVHCANFRYDWPHPFKNNNIHKLKSPSLYTSLGTSVILGKLHRPSVYLFPHMLKCDNCNTYLTNPVNRVGFPTPEGEQFKYVWSVWCIVNK